MTVDGFIKAFPDVKISREQRILCYYLEDQGFRFLVDFGYENAGQILCDKLSEKIRISIIAIRIVGSKICVFTANHIFALVRLRWYEKLWLQIRTYFIK
jgi:hypothetical protein